MLARFKVCCIQDEAEAQLAVAAGASLLGLVSAMPSGPGVLPEERIAAIARVVPPGVESVLLSARTDAEGLVAQIARCRTSAVQLVAPCEPDVHEALRQIVPGLRVIQVVHVEDEGALEIARRAAETADALLLDSGAPSASTPELGGTGRTHDWALSRAIVEASPKPVLLAGGLGPENAREAWERVRPYALDLCSALRPAGALQPELLSAFATALRGAD